jgi:hypothetical protein
MHRSTYRLAGQFLRVTILVLMLGTVLAQVLVRVAASHSAVTYPELAYLELPYSVAAILFIACVQVALLTMWPLLSRVDHGIVLTRPTVRWINVIATCGAVAAVLSAGVLVHMIVVVGAGGPVFYYLGACVVGGVAAGLTMVVTRGVLESAIADHTRSDSD